MASQAAGAAPSMSKLTLESSGRQTKSLKQKKKVVADSWEDEDDESESEEPASSDKDQNHATGVAAPPPTPASPTYKSAPWQSMSMPMSPESTGATSFDEASRRPEKTDAVARRMIASALGVKAPRMTEEQRAYDKAVKEKEKKRKEEEKAAEKKRQEEAAKVKAAMWDD